MKMGLGKTRLLLELLSTGKRALVVCTKSNIQVWANEIEKFFPDLNYMILHNDFIDGNTYDVTKKTIKKCQIVITTYETVRAHFELSQPKCFIIQQDNFHEPSVFPYSKNNIPDGFKINNIIKTRNTKKYSPIYTIKYERIVADECQYFASVNSKIYQAMACLKGEYHYAVSGTPIVNSELDLFSAFKFIGLKIKPNEFKKEYYDNNNLKNYIISKDYSDTTIKIPKLNNITIESPLSDIEKKMYNDMVLQLKDAYASFQKGNDTFAAPLGMFVRLRQICLCPYIITKESKKPRRVKKDETLPNILRNDVILKNLIKYINIETLDNLMKAYPELENKLRTPFWRFKLVGFGLLPEFELFTDPKLNLELANPDNIKKWSRIKKIIEQIKLIHKRKEKVLVFSSFVSFLNVLGDELKELGVSFRQLDGSTKSSEREKIVKDFNEKDTITVFLSSYKAGGVGLTMTSATNVILAEPWWNSATEQQAVFRTHRIGQTKPVNVYSMITNPSFEVYLLKIQQIKSNKVEEYLGDSKTLIKRSVAKQIIENVIYGDLL